jgi:uncharacterized protein (TIGR03437 family)
MAAHPRWVLVVTFLLAAHPWAQGAGVTVRFDPSSPEVGPFPADSLTVADVTQKTGVRVNLPLSNCAAQPSTCEDLKLINELDGFNLRPRVRVRFSGPVNTATLRSGIFLVALDDVVADVPGVHSQGQVIAINQVIFDPDTNTAYAEADEVLDQHRHYAVVVTDAVRDASGEPVEEDPAYGRCLAPLFQSAYCRQLSEVVKTLQVPGKIVAASRFTTMSATSWLEKARRRIQDSTMNVHRPSPKNTFKVGGLLAFSLRLQVKSNPPAFEEFTVPQPLLAAILADVDRIAFASFDSPRFLDAKQTIPAVPTAGEVALPSATTEVHFHAFLPKGDKPKTGYPVVIFGHGLNDSRFGAPTLVANTFARNGFATVAMNAVGHGSGPESTVSLLELSGSTTLAAGGRSIDLNGDGNIDSREGCLLPGPGPFGLRDCLRQTALDLAQFVRVLRGGLDVDGDGSVDLDPGRIYYAGQSLGALYGTAFNAIEPEIRAAALNAGGATVMDIARWSPSFHSVTRDFLGTRMPPLLNAGGDFDENYVLRSEPAKTNDVAGAIDIQNLFETSEWLQMSGDPIAYAAHLKRAPLAGATPKRVLWQFARGDRTVPNPQNSALIRTAGMREESRLYRHDLARAVAPELSENPHAFLVDIQSAPGFTIAAAAQQQIAGFFAADGMQIPDVNKLVPLLFGRNVFETPASLPEDFGFGASVVSVSAASYDFVVAPESIVAAGGSGLAVRTELAMSRSLPTSLAGTTVRVLDSTGVERLAALFFVSPHQVNYVLPAGTTPGLARVTVTSGDGTASAGTAQVEAVAPALFTANASGSGVAAAVATRVKADGSQSSEVVFQCLAGPGTCLAKPIDLGAAGDRVYLLLFGTGIRGRSGLPAVRLTLDGANVPVDYAGAQSEFAGLDQVNAGPVPRSFAGHGETAVELTVDGKPANIVTISFQ